jgi:hypothetical protein
MTSAFENLCGPGKPLKAEPPDAKEFAGLVRSARARLKDAGIEQLSLESGFDLAYNAAHAFCLAALRRHGYRSGNRYLDFQLLPLTLGLGPDVWRVPAKCHEVRNLAEYEGLLDVDQRLFIDLVAACRKVEARVEALPDGNGYVSRGPQRRDLRGRAADRGQGPETVGWTRDDEPAPWEKDLAGAIGLRRVVTFIVPGLRS